MDITLTPEEVRVLGSLLEKEMATPEYYPLTLNALVSACNQKTSRSPVTDYDEKTVLAALAGLERKRLVWKSTLGRVPKYEQSFVRNTKLVGGEVAVLCVLMLRGPQTPGEIRAHVERLFDFRDPVQLGRVIDDLVDAGYIARTGRMPGQKEARYSHLFSGPSEHSRETEPVPGTADAGTAQGRAGGLDDVWEELRCLRGDLEDLRREVKEFMARFTEDLGA
ncbi:MAG TPA: YceH family protein [Deltaproteobacteria bacterium]|nr:YceH family protein [Deltaproteobacteria bacterium]